MLVFKVNQTNFIEKPIEDIAYFDVNEFFARFKEKMLRKVEIVGELMEFVKGETRVSNFLCSVLDNFVLF